MDSFEMNKILGAILGTALVVVALNIASGAIFAPVPAKPGYNIVVRRRRNQPAPAGAAGCPVLASADLSAARTPPSLPSLPYLREGRSARWTQPLGRGRRMHASMPGFDYSGGMKSMSGGWTVDELYQFLEHPQGYVPGTKMTFGGISRPQSRADIIAYLNTQSDNPVPLPKAADAKP